MSDVPKLELRHLTRQFDERSVVSDVSFSVAAGEVTCLLGPSGCGKSTTLHMIAGIEQPDDGEILVDGHVISDRHKRVPPEERHIGFMFQDFALFPHLTVIQNVAYGLKRLGSNLAAEEAFALLARVGLERYADSYPPT